MINELAWKEPTDTRPCARKTCHIRIVEGDEVGCACHKYGYAGHEDQAWCSEACLEADHPA